MADRPNVLVIMTDQQKATASHLYGNSFCETPSMERLANEGVLFEHAITPHPLCVPARVAFWTSRFPHANGSRRNETLMPAGAEHAFRLWKEAGYRTGLIGKNHCFKREEDLQLFDVWCAFTHGGRAEMPETWGMDWFRPEAGRNAVKERVQGMKSQSPRFGYATTDLPLEDHSTGLIAGQAVRFLEQSKDEPFALWVSFPDPHEPWIVPEQYAAMFPQEKIELPPWREREFAGEEVPERNRVLYEMLGMEEDALDDVCGVMGVYHGMVRFIDDGLGQILDALERLGLREDTIVVFCADHGDFMGEHRMACKGGVFYDCLTRVPLILSWPGQVAEGERDGSLVNLVDVVPTLLQLQGMEAPCSMQGEGLPTVTDEASREATFSEYGAGGPPFGMEDLEKLEKPYGRRGLIRSLQWREAEGRRKMVRTRAWKYVHDSMGDRDELYDLKNDPWELVNVVGDPGNAGVVSEMRLRLADWSIDTEDAPPVPLPAGDRYDL
ncbi:MAG: sulfatase-like hydrolase/transferase [Gemmatimonadetes bacterium]|jgi:arylsulfatase A-like enzyme|nr:sulfatase-like hydrolase/transferase [Gemmatimonadota bacterium]